MKPLLFLAFASAWNRRATLGLMAISIALSVMLLLGVEQLRTQARESFSQSISGTDLVVGARTSPIQLMLYAVFRLGDATHNIRWSSFQMMAQHPAVAWAVPISLGDSHRGFAVIGTTTVYFEHFRYADRRLLTFASGKPFADIFDAVVGADVAEQLGYQLGDSIVLNHGAGGIGLAEHADKPFTVSGILKRTGLAVDRSVHISLEAIEAIHLDWQGGAPMPGLSIPAAPSSSTFVGTGSPKNASSVMSASEGMATPVSATLMSPCVCTRLKSTVPVRSVGARSVRVTITTSRGGSMIVCHS